MKKCFLIIISLSFFSIGFGQIFFHDYDPDIEAEVLEVPEGYASELVYCDINIDSTDDLRFILEYWYTEWPSATYDEAFSCFVSPINGQHQFGYENDMCNIKSLNPGDTIWSNLEWISEGDFMFKDGFGCEPFSQYHYMALKLNFDDGIHYGWLKVRSFYQLWGQPHAILRISEFAYNLVPDVGMIAGDTITNLLNTNINSSFSEDNLFIYPNPANDFLIIDNADEYKSLLMVDVFGRTVYRRDNLQKAERIACKNFSDGLYFMTFIGSTKMYSRKVIIRKY